MKMEMKLNIIEPRAGKSYAEDTVSVSRTMITIGTKAAEKMDLKANDHILIATLGPQLFFAKRPAETIPGVKLSNHSPAHKRLSTHSKEIQKKYQGTYKVGDFVVQQVPDKDKRSWETIFHQLVKQ